MSDILKKHTHEQRDDIIQALIPHIRRHVGRNLVALAASGSYASGTDSDYSDIDLIAFVRRPESVGRSVVRFLYDGLAIDIRLTTRTEYLRAYKHNVRPDWPYAARRALAPLVNEAFIRRIADTPSKATLCACRKTLQRFLPDVQEAAAKMLTAAQCNAPDSLRLYEIFAERLCVALSLLNGRAYTTRAVIFREAPQFSQLPAHFEQLMNVSVADTPAELAGRTRQILAEFEELIVAVGIGACETDLGFFVSPQSRLQRLSEGLGIDRIGGRVRRVLMKVLGRASPAATPELDIA